MVSEILNQKSVQQIPWVEYIVNYGWLGQSGIWAYVVNRIQDKAAILYIPLEAFSKLENSEIPSDSVDQSKPTVDQPMETNQIKPIQMLHYWTSPYWVSVSHRHREHVILQHLGFSKLEAEL